MVETYFHHQFKTKRLYEGGKQALISEQILNKIV